MFVKDEDYKVVIGQQALAVLSQTSEDIRNNAELQAQEEISGYLRPVYDSDKVFAARGNERNRQIVMYCCDIALYNMASSVSGRMGMDIRKERYERAIQWLEGVAKGQIVPDLPHATDESGAPIGGVICFGSEKKLRNNW